MLRRVGTITHSARAVPRRGAHWLAGNGPRKVPLVIDGELVQSKTQDWVEVTDPSTNEVVALTPKATADELKASSDNAQQAFAAWKETPASVRQRVFLKMANLVNRDMDKLSALVVEEAGKTAADAQGDVFRGLEVVETAAAAHHLTLGDTLSGAGRDIDTYSIRQPLGVCAGVCPFNFPAMIPLWMFPLAVALGNTYVMKPSEKDPSTAVALAELAMEAGLPKGVLNLIHGEKEPVQFICHDENIKAISFVGADAAGRYIHSTGTANGKRVQSNMSAKNHAIIMPDADKEATLSALAGAAFGATGQRCMAISVAVFVGETKEWIPEIVKRAEKLKLGPGTVGDADIGPMISPEAKARAQDLVQSAVDAGADLMIDGRNPTVEGFPNGNWFGPTLLANMTPDMVSYKEELFAPVLQTMNVDTIEDAIDLVNSSPYGNGAAIFTRSGAAARLFQHTCEAGQLGINIPIPVPLPFFSFTGNKDSHVGNNFFYGADGAKFFTTTKTITSAWHKKDIDLGVRTAFPTMK